MTTLNLVEAKAVVERVRYAVDSAVSYVREAEDELDSLHDVLNGGASARDSSLAAEIRAMFARAQIQMHLAGGSDPYAHIDRADLERLVAWAQDVAAT